MDEKPDRENSDPTYDPLDNGGMCLVYIVSLSLFWMLVIWIAK